jgi:hypothetical protein
MTIIYIGVSKITLGYEVMCVLEVLAAPVLDCSQDVLLLSPCICIV